MYVPSPVPAGDVLLTAAYLSYVGCFGRPYRIQLLQEKWIPFLKTLEVITLELLLYLKSNKLWVSLYKCMVEIYFLSSL